ncbi:MAG TPA: efflux RND transporter permease subunit [Bryobacteraceae bacterium]|jgi:HAE1 family hydrophobic/amphiphilic exporter-1|nr:efflux RND transporter permease subunit [Bryobacteraceae bacterium]
MPRFSIRNPYFIVVCCLALAVIGINAAMRMPVDLFPPINLPVITVATFYNGMPPIDIETDITNPLERWFTQASGMDHMESRSLLGVSIIKAYFQPGTDADADLTQLSNLALADLKRLPPGTLPPVVLKFDASSLPVALVTVKGEGMTETQLHDTAQFTIRNQLAVIKGAEIPAVFGGKYRQAMIYVDPYRLFSRQLSVMDVVDAVNKSNLILPAGDVKIGPNDYYVYSNSMVNQVKDLDNVPIKTIGQRWVSIGDIGEAKDASQLQYNIVRIDGQKSAYIPVMKSGGDSNTIQVVDDLRNLTAHLFDLPPQLVTNIVFDQSKFVRDALRTVMHEGLMGLVLTGLMILLFLGSMRATGAVLLSIPISALATVVVLYLLGSTINTMILGGLALAFSRVIDNSVISLENIYRHLEMGASPAMAAEQGGAEVNLAVLAATLVDVVDFFPVTMLFGVSKFLFSALALAFCLALLASFVVAMTVIPLFCAKFLKGVPAGHGEHAHVENLSWGGRFNAWFNRQFNRILDGYEFLVRGALRAPLITLIVLVGVFAGSLLIYPLLGQSFFPRTDAGQFTINVKVPTGTRLEVTNDYVAKIEDVIRHVVAPGDLKMILSNIGVVNDISSLYTSNAGMYMATIQVALNDGHATGSYEYMDKLRAELAQKFPEVRTFFQSGSLQDAILNQGQPAPIDVQVNTRDLGVTYKTAQDLAARIRALPGAGEIYIPQDMNYPSVRLDIDRVHAAELGLTQADVIDNVITALNSNIMIAPNYWVDYKTGNDYFLSVQYPESGSAAIHSLIDLRQIPLRAPNLKQPTTLDTVARLVDLQSPTEVDHYQIQRVVDVYVTPKGEDLGRLRGEILNTIQDAHLPSNIRVNLRGMVNSMEESFKSFGLGFGISFILLFLILVAQFRSWIDPFLIMLAIPMGFVGVLIILPLTHTTLNVMSLMGVLMLIGIADSNSILIVDFAHKLEEQGYSVADAVIMACRVRLRPILMTSLATIIGMLPMAMKLGEGGEQYTPMARAIIGGLTSSVLLTIFIVPAAYLLVYGRKRPHATQPE